MEVLKASCAEYVVNSSLPSFKEDISTAVESHWSYRRVRCHWRWYSGEGYAEAGAMTRPIKEACGRTGCGTEIGSYNSSGQRFRCAGASQSCAAVAPKWSVWRVFNDDDGPVPLSRGRFQVLSSDDELGNSREFVPTQMTVWQRATSEGCAERMKSGAIPAGFREALQAIHEVNLRVILQGGPM